MKKTIRVFLASFLILCLFSVSAFAFAAQVPGEITDGNQNLEAYISETDKHAIQKVIGELLNVRSEQITNLSQSVDYSRFWSPNAETVNRQIFDNCINGKLAVISNLDVARKNSVPELKFSNYNKVGNVVHVEVSEWLPFAYCEKTLKEQPSEYTSGEENTYAFDLEKCGNEWKILAVDFKDIFYDHLKKPDVSIDSFVQGCLDGGSVYIAEAERRNDLLAASVPSTRLNAALVKEYAIKYGGTKRNSLFPKYGGDCQNFASQCIWYGLGGINSKQAIEGGYAPMIASGDRRWCNMGGSKYSGTWTVVGTFANYVNSGGSNKLGLYGNIYDGASYAEVGDIIQIYGDGEYYHSYVVVKTTAPYGSRTAESIYVCSHTTDLQEILLSERTGSDPKLRTIKVTGTIESPG